MIRLVGLNFCLAVAARRVKIKTFYIMAHFPQGMMVRTRLVTVVVLPFIASENIVMTSIWIWMAICYIVGLTCCHTVATRCVKNKTLAFVTSMLYSIHKGVSEIQTVVMVLLRSIKTVRVISLSPSPAVYLRTKS